MTTSKKSMILEHLKLLQFGLVSPDEINFWTKNYSGCSINVNLESGWIDYPEEIKIHHHSTTKLSDDEDFVVLECVDRLLRKGYPANKIELEKTWKVGRGESGRLDVLVRCKNSEDIYLMIECKTEDTYDKSLYEMKYNGGQLFSYLQQDQSTKFVCLYASWIYQFCIRHRYALIPVSQSIRDSKNMYEMYDNWNKKFIIGGDVFEDNIFGSNVSPYSISIET